jgi:hypothetical protein
MGITRVVGHGHWRGLLVTVAALLLLTGVCGADVKIISEVTVTGGPARAQAATPGTSQQAGSPSGTPATAAAKPEIPKTVTTYYKARMARTEVEGGPLTIYDGQAGKVFILHPDQQTYSVFSLGQMLEQSGSATEPSSAGGRGRGARFDVKVNLEKSDATKTIAGKEAAKYVLTASMQLISRRGGGFGGGRGFPGGGGFPRRGGRFPRGGFPLAEGASPSGETGGAPSPGGPGIGSIQIQGEYWLADAAFLPAAENSPLLPLLSQTLRAGPILRDLNSKLVKSKQVPLSSKLTMTRPNAESQEPLVTTMEVKTITEGPLDDALFKVPDGYKEVKPARQGR